MRSLLLLLAFFTTFNLCGQVGSDLIASLSQMIVPYQTANSLDGMVNSPVPEVRPYITPDGQTLYFGRRNHPDNSSGLKDPQDIWTSTLSPQGVWSEPKRMDGRLNDKWANAVVNISLDGKTGIFYNTNKKLNVALVKSTYTKTGWSEPSPIYIEDYSNRHQYADFYAAIEHNVLLLAIEREEGLGEQDLYVSHLNRDGSYSAPVNLGNTINTSNSDFAPFLSVDGNTLFFISSNREGGFGAGDIYMSERLDNTWQSWTTPVNMGKSVNSVAHECFFSISSDFRFIYIDSAKPGDKDRNIKLVAFPEFLKSNKFQASIYLPKVSG